MEAMGGDGPRFQCMLSVLRRKSTAERLGRSPGSEVQSVLCGCFTFPGRSPSGRSKQRPHSQWRDRAGFTPDFPVMPLAGTQTRSRLYHDAIDCDKSRSEQCGSSRCSRPMTERHRGRKTSSFETLCGLPLTSEQVPGLDCICRRSPSCQFARSARRQRAAHDVGNTGQPADRRDSPLRPLRRRRSRRSASHHHHIGQERRTDRVASGISSTIRAAKAPATTRAFASSPTSDRRRITTACATSSACRRRRPR